ncbi:hypothetical protein D3C77_466200 [compost metagenome]
MKPDERRQPEEQNSCQDNHHNHFHAPEFLRHGGLRNHGDHFPTRILDSLVQRQIALALNGISHESSLAGSQLVQQVLTWNEIIRQGMLGAEN